MLGVAVDMFRYPFQKEHSYDRHKDVMKKLKFIARIQAGDRINVNTISTTTNTFFSAMYRTLFKESRKKTYDFLTDVIDRSFELIVLYQESTKMSDRITCSHIFEDLHHSINGLRNLQITYNDDQNFYCEIDTLIGSIYARLAELYEKKELFISEEQRVRLQTIIFPNNVDKLEEKVDIKLDIQKEVKPDIRLEIKQQPIMNVGNDKEKSKENNHAINQDTKQLKIEDVVENKQHKLMDSIEQIMNSIHEKDKEVSIQKEEKRQKKRE